jgi:hypothetical protein
MRHLAADVLDLTEANLAANFPQPSVTEGS